MDKDRVGETGTSIRYQVEHNELKVSENCNFVDIQDVSEIHQVLPPECEAEDEVEVHTIGDHIYSGMISSGVLHGVGHFEWCDGIAYDGDFLCGKVTGAGKYRWPDGSVYDGDVSNGLRDGRGSFICANKKTVYTGQWKSGKRDGEGKLIYNLDNPSYCYDGYWVENMKDGYGKMQYCSGNVYEGEWRNDKQHGVGTMHWFARREVYTGEWVNGYQHGVGTHLWTFKSSDSSQYPLRNWYEGDWVRGHKEGHGIFHYSSGSYYEGSWKDDKKHGQGYFISKNGLKFQCYFVDDRIQSTSEDCALNKLTSGDIEKFETSNDLMLTMKELMNTLDSSHLQALVLRNISEIRQTYIFYSSLGAEICSDRVSVMNGLQFSVFLQDINIQQYGLTIFDVECILGGNSNSFATIHDPNRHILMKDFRRTALLLATKSRRLSSDHVESLLKAVLSLARNVCGRVFSGRTELTFEILKFKDHLWKIYLNINITASASGLMKYRDIWTLFKKSSLFSTQLSKRKNSSELLKLIADGALDCLNLEVKLSFLEFFEVILKFIIVTVPLSESSSISQWHQHLERICDELWRVVTV